MMRHGADAVLVGRRLGVVQATAAELSAKTGRRAIGVSADVRRPEALSDAVQVALREFGRIDFVICCAAGNFLADLANISPNGFASVIQIDTIGTFNTIWATLAEVKRNKGVYLSVSATLHYSALPFQAHGASCCAALRTVRPNGSTIEASAAKVRPRTVSLVPTGDLRAAVDE